MTEKKRSFWDRPRPNVNPVLAYVILMRRAGARHSEFPWGIIREDYDYCEEEVENKDQQRQPTKERKKQR